MMYRIEIASQADADLRGIYEYIAFSLQAPQNAVGQLDRLEDGILKLTENPERFKRYEKEPWRSRGLRQMPIDNFLIFYILEEEIVTIIRVMYDGRNIDAQLRKTIM